MMGNIFKLVICHLLDNDNLYLARITAIFEGL